MMTEGAGSQKPESNPPPGGGIFPNRPLNFEHHTLSTVCLGLCVFLSVYRSVCVYVRGEGN